MECAICFEEKHNFKVLKCNHAFCSKCVEDIADGKLLTAAAAVTANSLKPSAAANGGSEEGRKETSPAASATATIEIECPTCRRLTALQRSGKAGGENASWKKLLPTKYIGNLQCSRCDESKSVDEFRWCHDCSVSVCSRCFIDKHVNTSGEDEAGKPLGLHSATKWDANYPAVRFCLQQLLGELEEGRERASKAKEYIRSYLEGLQEYMCVEIDQKTKCCENDIRRVITDLSEAYGIDSTASTTRGGLEAAKIPNRSYQYLIKPLYQLMTGQHNVPLPPLTVQKQRYKLNSVPYKDITAHLLAAEKPSLLSSSLSSGGGSELFFDPIAVARKLAGECVVIGGSSNLINHPSDACLLRFPDSTTKTVAVAIIDHESGVYLFKPKQNMQLQGPLPLKHPCARYARIAVVPPRVKNWGDGAGGRSTNSANVLVTCQAASNGPWQCILINISADTSKHEQLRSHFGLPSNENMHLVSSERVLFGLSTAHAQKLWRLNIDDEFVVTEEKTKKNCWKELYTVINASNNPGKPYCRIGPICDYTDHTEVLITNGAWQSIDIIKFGWPDDRLWSVKRVELAASFPAGNNAPVSGLNNFSEPALFPCYGNTTDPAILVDRQQSIIQLLQRANKRSFKLAEFVNKVPKKCLFIDANTILLIVQGKNNPQIRSLELYA